MRVVVIDGQGGRMGRLVVEKIRAEKLPCEIVAVGTNAIATAEMLKAGADAGATGENPVIVACRRADVIVGPIGILAADSMLGEVTPAMALAVGQSGVKKLLLPAVTLLPSSRKAKRWKASPCPSRAWMVSVTPFLLPSVPLLSIPKAL